MHNKKFENLRKGIREELLRANDHFHITSQLLYVPDSLRKVLRGKYQIFFFYTTWAHIKVLCLSIYNVTKYDEQTYNIPRLLCYMRNQQDLMKLYSANEICDIEKQLKSHADILDYIYILRDKHYAHNQSNTRKLDITLDYIVQGCKPLLRTLNNIYDFLSSRYDCNQWVFQTAGGATIEELLTDLTEYKKIKRLQARRNSQE